MTRKIGWVASVTAVVTLLAACNLGGMRDMQEPEVPPHVGTWHFAPNAMVEIEAAAFKVTVGDGMMPLDPEPPFDQVTRIVVGGSLGVADGVFSLTVDPDSVVVEPADPQIHAVVRSLVLVAASDPATVHVHAMPEPVRMTITAPSIALLLGLPADARLRACRDMPCVAPNVMRWWNTLGADRRVAALHGDTAVTSAEEAAARMRYESLDPRTSGRVRLAATLIDGHVSYDSVGAWWESLNCRERRVAVGDGNVTDPASAYCAHYPGSGAMPVLGDIEKAFVDTVGMALLGLDDPGTYPPHAGGS